MKKSICIFFSSFLLICVLYAGTQEEQVKVGSVDVYLGIFNTQDISIDYYIRISNATITLTNFDHREVVYSGLVDLEGFMHLDEIIPGKYIITVESEEGTYLFQKGMLLVKPVEDSKVYLHVERNVNLIELQAKAEKIDFALQSVILVGEILEISNSTSIFRDNQEEQNSNLKKTEKKKVIKK